MSAKLELHFRHEYWCAQAEIRLPGSDVKLSIVTTGRKNAPEAVKELVEDIRSECDKIVNDSNKWLEKLEQSGVKHGVPRKEIVFHTVEEDLPSLPTECGTKAQAKVEPNPSEFLTTLKYGKG